MILGVAGWLHAGITDKRIIREWWINRLLDQYFAQAANTRIVSDFELICDFSGDSSFFSKNQSFEIFSESSKRNGLLTKGFGGLLIHAGALDPISGRLLSSSDGIAFRSITKNGFIRRTTQSDSISSTIIVSEETDKMLGKEKHISKLGHSSILSIKSQGVSEETYERSLDFIENTFSPMKEGDIK